MPSASAQSRVPSPSLLLIVSAVPLLLYARTIGFDFVHADDADLIAANQTFLSDLRNVPRAFTRSYFEVEGEFAQQKTYYRPVAIVSFMLDTARGGLNPRAYRVTNVVLHAAATCLLFALAMTWGAPPWAGLAAALVFAVHPVNVQAVAWIAGRNDLLVAVFGLISLMTFAALKGCATKTGVGQPFRAAGHILAFALALFSKEIGLFVPVIAVLHQWLVRRERLTRLQQVALGCDGVIVIVWAVLRARALAGMPPEVSIHVLGVALANAPQLLVHAGKMLAPMRLNVAPGVDSAGIFAGAVAVLLFAWVSRRWLPRGVAIVAVCWVLMSLLPTLLVPALPVYEHRAYVPLIGVLIALAAGLAGRKGPPWNVPLQNLAGRRGPPYTVPLQKPGGVGRPFTGRQIVGVSVVSIVAILATLTWQRQGVFRDAFTYWTDGTRDAQFGPIAHVNLGQLHESAGRPADARREYLRALERDPNTPKAHNNLGVVLMTLNEPELAVVHFKEETARHPWNADAWFNLGLWTEMRGDAAAARRYYERAVVANPAYAPAYQKLGRTPPD